MNSLNLESAEIVRILIVAVALIGALGLLKLAFKLTKRILMLGCLGIVIILGVMLVLAFAP
ncbi:MAG: hypothetical protein JXA42_00380 [Anaerolineales bacterium]|nr:hypothetical protein [Anaerolineales bacterium]